MNLSRLIDHRPSDRAGAWLVYALAGLLITAKWLLVNQNEIISEPHDAHQYVLIAENVAAGGGGKSIGYPLWLSATRLTGLPQRLVIEGLWVLASALFAWLLARVAGRSWLLPVALAILLFSPATLFLFDHALTEGLFLCLTLLLASASLALLGARSFRGALVASFCGGMVAGYMLISRNEAPLITAYLVLLVMSWVLLQRTCHGLRWFIIWPQLIGILAALGLTTTTPSLLAAGQNQKRYGVFTVNFAEMPSHMAMLKRLAAIDTGIVGRRFIPISRAARELAYGASSSLAPFRPFIEDPANVYQIVTQETYGTTGEIGAGWIWHVFNQCAPSVGASSPAAMDALYRRINIELSTAFRDGRLKQRFVAHPFIGADAGLWMNHLPEGFTHALHCIASPTPPLLDQGYATDLFDRACLRRQSLIPRGTLRLGGWAFFRGSDGGLPVTRLRFDFANGSKTEIPLEPSARADVQAGFATQGVVAPLKAGFSVVLSAPAPLESLSFIGTGGIGAKWDHPAVGKAVSLTPLTGVTNVEAGLDELSLEEPSWLGGFRGRSLAGLMKIGSSPLAWWGAVIVACSALFIRGRSRRHPCISPLFVTSLLFAAWSIGRVLFYAVITAGAWQAEARYLQPAAVLTVCAVLAACCSLAEVKNSQSKKSLS